MSHWSDGDPNYSGGPPNVDSVLTVNRVWTFYNATGATLPCVNSKAPCTVGEIAANQTNSTSGSGGSKTSGKNGEQNLNVCYPERDAFTGTGRPTSSALVPLIGLLSIIALFIA